MKKFLLTLLLAGGMACGASAEELSQTLYFDFGTITASQGSITEGADANGHFWNNITNNTSGNKYAAAGTVYDGLVNSANEATGYKLTLNSRFSTNGKSGGGGLMTPDADLLGDMAVATATEDYFFIESSENNSNFTISGLDPQKGYRFHIFASRKASDTRTGIYRMDGINNFAGELQLAGTNLGGENINQNIANILVSEVVFPDDNGDILFTVSRKTGAYIALNAMKVEEFSGMTRPEAAPSIVSATLTGSAAENGVSATMHLVSPDGKNNGIYECFTLLKPGTFHFTTKTDKDTDMQYGVKDGKVSSADDAADYTVETEQLSMVKANFTTGELTVLPITSCAITGSAVHGWSTSNVEELPYAGNGVWSGELTLTNRPASTDRSRFNFILNNSWNYKFSRVSGTENSVGMSADGYTLTDINLNFGKYRITLDLNEFTYSIESPDGIDENRISVMGSSVANGQGATDNHGYAYMYDQLLGSRHSEGLSDDGFYISGISVNGNNTINLLNRYDELINEFGRYVIFGVSLGNEGIHGAADQEAVYNQFRDNMQLLISKAREDGKIPVVMNNYTRGDFEATDYEYVRRMNLLINSWDVPSVNLLGAIDNGSGNWADGYQNGDDIYHPDTEGHSEFFHAIPPSLFDAIKTGKTLPVRHTGNSVEISEKGKVEFIPEDVVHPFALIVNLNAMPEGRFATIAVADGSATLSVSDNTLTYTSPEGKTIEGTIATPAIVTLSHYHAQGRTLLYAGDNLLGEVSEKIAPEKITIAPATGKLNLGEVMFYRSALNADEVKAINEGTMFQSSLEMYLPFDDSSALNKNHAQSMTEATVDTGSTSGVTAVAGEETDAPFRAFGLEGRAIVTVAYPQTVTICAIDGRVIYNMTIDTTADLPLAPGVYFVNDTKLLVR